jgi:hypothetical protein
LMVRGTPPESETTAPFIVARITRRETRQASNAAVERSPAHCTGWPMVPCS